MDLVSGDYKVRLGKARKKAFLDQVCPSIKRSLQKFKYMKRALQTYTRKPCTLMKRALQT